MGIVHMKIGPLIGEHLLEIAQTNISNGNIKKGIETYLRSLHGFQFNHVLMCLKNEAVIVTDEDGTSVTLTTDEKAIKNNAHNIFDWRYIINKRWEDIISIRENLINTENEFHKYYNGDILDYSMIDMMKRYFTDEELSVIGLHNIAARICGDAECKICDKGSSNPWSVWTRLEGKMENYEDTPDVAKWEKILYYTVTYNKLIRLLHKEYLNFDNTYCFLSENGFIKKPAFIELFIENTLKTLVEFSDTSKGYIHPLCNIGLYNYKKSLIEDLKNTNYGKEYLENNIIKKNIMDGYDAGWLSPSGEFYGGNGETSAMIHMNIAEQIFDGNSIYANKMKDDSVSIFGGIDSPEYWLEKHGWVKIHHEDCYGSFIGHRGEEPTPDYPYSYIPTEIQVKMICDYADKYYGGKFYTEANALGRVSKTEPFSTYAVRQMDDIKLHETFGR